MNIKTISIKLFIFLIVGAGAEVASAATHKNVFNSYYVGASLGESITMATSNVSNAVAFFYPTSNVGVVTVPLNASLDLHNNALIASIFFGAGHAWGLFYLGGETFLNYSQYNRSNTIHNGDSFFSTSMQETETLTTTTSMNLNDWQYGLDLRTGVVWRNTTLFFATIGMALTQFNLISNTSATETFSSNVGNDNLQATFNQSANRSTIGLRLGLGLEQAINSRLRYRVSYVYTTYGKVNVNASNSTAIDSVNFGHGQAVITNNSDVSLANQSILVGIIYGFAT